jgi:hypothetical protein
MGPAGGPLAGPDVFDAVVSKPGGANGVEEDGVMATYFHLSG